MWFAGRNESKVQSPKSKVEDGDFGLWTSDFGLSAQRLGKRYGGRVVFKNLDFSVAGGSVAAVLGANGAGKSTLLKIVAGLVRPTAGSVHLSYGQTLLPVEKFKWLCGLA